MYHSDDLGQTLAADKKRKLEKVESLWDYEGALEEWENYYSIGTGDEDGMSVVRGPGVLLVRPLGQDDIDTEDQEEQLKQSQEW